MPHGHMVILYSRMKTLQCLKCFLPMVHVETFAVDFFCYLRSHCETAKIIPANSIRQHSKFYIHENLYLRICSCQENWESKWTRIFLHAQYVGLPSPSCVFSTFWIGHLRLEKLVSIVFLNDYVLSKLHIVLLDKIN